jgi:hypothetical protein
MNSTLILSRKFHFRRLKGREFAFTRKSYDGKKTDNGKTTKSFFLYETNEATFPPVYLLLTKVICKMKPFMFSRLLHAKMAFVIKCLHVCGNMLKIEKFRIKVNLNFLMLMIASKFEDDCSV